MLPLLLRRRQQRQVGSSAPLAAVHAACECGFKGMARLGCGAACPLDDWHEAFPAAETRVSVVKCGATTGSSTAGSIEHAAALNMPA
jgi:hypothetical protein